MRVACIRAPSSRGIWPCTFATSFQPLVHPTSSVLMFRTRLATACRLLPESVACSVANLVCRRTTLKPGGPCLMCSWYIPNPGTPQLLFAGVCSLRPKGEVMVNGADDVCVERRGRPKMVGPDSDCWPPLTLSFARSGFERGAHGFPLGRVASQGHPAVPRRQDLRYDLVGGHDHCRTASHEDGDAITAAEVQQPWVVQ
jgi:hypothetical protein